MALVKELVSSSATSLPFCTYFNNGVSTSGLSSGRLGPDAKLRKTLATTSGYFVSHIGSCAHRSRMPQAVSHGQTVQLILGAPFLSLEASLFCPPLAVKWVFGVLKYMFRVQDLARNPLFLQ